MSVKWKMGGIATLTVGPEACVGPGPRAHAV